MFGALLGMDVKTEPMTGTPRNVLLKSVKWLAGAPKLSDAEKAKQQAQSDLDFLRRERIWDWTLNERGPDRGVGIIPTLRNLLAVPLESRLYTLQYMSGHLSGSRLAACQAAEGELKKAVAGMEERFQKTMAETAAGINKMTIKDLIAENPELNRDGVLQKIESAPGKTDEARKKMKANPGGTKAVAHFLHGEEYSAKLMPEARKKELIARADKAIADLWPAVRAAKAASLAEERKRDAAAVPGLIEKCSAPDASARLAAVIDLGRIGDPGSAPALIKMLKDADEKVRINAIIGLGWMQSKEAVPELLKLAGGNDAGMRRRALQALGQIGDDRAIETLLACIGHQDLDSAENAILALGWLKAKPAVAPLLKMVAGAENMEARQRAIALAAIRALGHIGDAAALPALGELAAKAKDFPFDARRRQRKTNIYSTADSLGVQGFAELAIKDIKAGGRKEKGVKQSEALAAADNFYGLVKRFNALAGRSSILRDSNFADDPSALIPYQWEAGFTGVHQAWGEDNFPDPEQYALLVRTAGDFDLLWVDVMPARGKSGAHGLFKPSGDLVLMKFQDAPAFRGFWWEETYPDLSITAAEFEGWLKNKHGNAFRKKLGLNDNFDMSSVVWSTWNDAGGSGSDGKNKYSPQVRAELSACLGEKLLASWKESQEWMRGLRKGCAFTYSVSDAQPLKYPGVASGAGSVIDVNGPETYQCFGRFNSFFMELFKNGEARPAMSEFYNWYSPSPAHDIRGFAQHLMHGECFYAFALTHIFEQQPYDVWSWDPTRWDNARKIFLKARAVREYLAVPESAANVGLVISELSILPFDPLNIYVGGLGQGWMQYQSALWTVLNQSQIPTDILWAETLTPEKLKRYRVLVLSAARIVTEAQAKMLRDWVNAGGTLIASGTTSLFDELAVLQKDYRLADLFGVNYAGHAGEANPGKNDTYYWVQGGQPAEKFVFGLNPESFKNYIHRDIKPVKSLGAYSLAAGKESALPGVAAGASCEYDMPLGYDKVKLFSAEVLAKFANGDPALTVNKAGKGLCYFWTPLYPALSHTTSEWEMFQMPLLSGRISAIISHSENGLANQSATLPVEVSGVSVDVEVTVRQQPDQNRWMALLITTRSRNPSRARRWQCMRRRAGP